MSNEAKTLFGIGIVTLIILFGGVYFLSKTPTGVNTRTQKADSKLLIRKESNKITAESAKLTLVEFVDFQCPGCGNMHPVVKQILKDNKGKITFVYRNYPLSQHKNAQIAAEAAEAAGSQRKYWEMVDLLFENQAEWSESNTPLDIFADYAKRLTLDVEKFKQEVSDQSHIDKINQDKDDGNNLGVNSTPTFFINNEKFEGTDLRTAIKTALKK